MNFVDATLLKEGDDYVIDAESFKAKTIKKDHAKLKPYIGKKVIFGIRPEDLHDKQYVSKDITEKALKAKVEVIEPLGAEIFIYLTIGKHSLVGKMDSRTQVKVEENIEVVIDMEKTHIFDAETLLTIV